MFCYNCGAENEKSYCVNCGVNLVNKDNVYKSFSYKTNQTKFCSSCGCATDKSYCSGCGKDNMNQTVDKVRGFGGSRKPINKSVEDVDISYSNTKFEVKDYDKAMQIMVFMLTAAASLYFLLVNSLMYTSDAVIVPLIFCIIIFGAIPLNEYMESRGKDFNDYIFGGATIGTIAYIVYCQTLENYSYGYYSNLNFLQVVLMLLLIIYFVSKIHIIRESLKNLVSNENSLEILEKFDGYNGLIIVSSIIVLISFIEAFGMYTIILMVLVTTSIVFMCRVILGKYDISKGIRNAMYTLIGLLVVNVVMGVILASQVFYSSSSMVVVYVFIYAGVSVFLVQRFTKYTSFMQHRVGNYSENRKQKKSSRVESQVEDNYVNTSENSTRKLRKIKSMFVGSPLGILGYNVLSFTLLFVLIYMFWVLEPWYDGEMGLIASIVIGGLFTSVIFAFNKFMIVRWEINNSVVDDERLRFTGSLVDYIGVSIYIFLLNVVTLGFYSFLGFAAAKRMKYKYNNIEGEAYFHGEYYQFLWIKIKMILLSIILIFVSYSMFRMSARSAGFYLPGLWEFTFDFGYYGGQFFDSVETLIFRSTIIFVFSIVLGTMLIYYYQVELMRWEIENVTAREKEWVFTGKIGEVFAMNIAFIILNAVTFNLLIFLGIQKYLLTKYKVTNTAIEQ